MALAAEADAEGERGIEKAGAEKRVFGDDAEDCEAEEAVEGGAGGAVCVVEDIGC